MSDKISVIVPIYNSESELERCLSSIQKQTYENIEVICVDDGSTDGSGRIADKFAMKDQRFIVIHQKNAGESCARNIGLETSTGSVIAFVDCDDFIEPNMYEILMEELVKNDLDIVAGSWSEDTDRMTRAKSNSAKVFDGVFGREQFLEYIYKRDIYQGLAYMWNKLYRRTCIEKRTGELIKFDTTLAIGGDVLFLAMAALNAKRVEYVDKPLYHYYQRDTSGIHMLSIAKMKDWVRAYMIVIDLLESELIDVEIVNYAKRFAAYHAGNGVKIAMQQCDDSAKKYFQSIMRAFEKEYISLNEKFPERVEEYKELLNK